MQNYKIVLHTPWWVRTHEPWIVGFDGEVGS